jgi:archaellum component FlaC
MTAISEEKLGKYFAKSFKEVVLPVLEGMDKKITGIESNMATKKDLERVTERLESVESGVDSLSRKFDAQQDRLDRHGKSIEKLEGKVSVLTS